MTVRALLGLGLLIATPAAGQTPTRAAGVVVLPSGPDAVPLPGAWVVIHRIGRATQGPFDSVRTGPHGRFELRFRADSTANYILSSRYAGIAYFSPPLATNPARPDTAIRLLVFDTSSTVRLRTRSRTLVVSGPDPTGARTVIDWFVVTNPGNRTRVGRDSLDPTWTAALPPAVRNPELGDARINEVSPEAVQFRADSILVFAPLSPGDKEILIQYQLAPAVRRLAIPAGGADSVDIFLEEAGAEVGPDGWKVTTQAFEGRRFRRFSRASRSAAPVTIRFPGLGIAPAALLPILIGGFGLALIVLSWAFLRSRRSPATAAKGGGPTADDIAARVADLDRRYRGKETETEPDEWAAYRTSRAALMRELRAALARARGEA